jgi:hypothetical protein
VLLQLQQKRFGFVGIAFVVSYSRKARQKSAANEQNRLPNSLIQLTLKPLPLRHRTNSGAPELLL